MINPWVLHVILPWSSECEVSESFRCAASQSDIDRYWELIGDLRQCVDVVFRRISLLHACASDSFPQAQITSVGLGAFGCRYTYLFPVSIKVRARSERFRAADILVLYAHVSDPLRNCSYVPVADL